MSATSESEAPGPGTGGEPADPPRADEPGQLPADVRRGTAADEAGGSVADAMRTPSDEQETREEQQLEQFDEHA